MNPAQPWQQAATLSTENFAYKTRDSTSRWPLRFPSENLASFWLLDWQWTNKTNKQPNHIVNSSCLGKWERSQRGSLHLKGWTHNRAVRNGLHIWTDSVTHRRKVSWWSIFCNSVYIVKMTSVSVHMGTKGKVVWFNECQQNAWWFIHKRGLWKDKNVLFYQHLKW